VTQLAWDAGFKRAMKQIARTNPNLYERIFETLATLEQDPFSPTLRTHKLRGQLEGLWACSVTYACRIVFSFETSAQDQSMILLIDVGTHEDVY
jgi:addiction module RelE/StbE family toxin